MVMESQTGASRYVLDMEASEARSFFLKGDSYCNLPLPPYIVFEPVLVEAVNALEPWRASRDRKDKRGKECRPEHCEKHNEKLNLKPRPEDCDRVNHVMMVAKGGRHAWRPIQLIHPLLYVDLVEVITRKENWKHIQSRFRTFQKQSCVSCMSMPVESLSDAADTEAQIAKWWSDVEQKAIELSLQYEVVAHTDITDCYGQIYTHSIAWALHGREVAKSNRKDKALIGNVVDQCIRGMRQGQTNGIPQGSVLMDFVAEIVLGYADCSLAEKMQTAANSKESPGSDADCSLAKNTQNQEVGGYQIVRYRDDYRIFAHSVGDAEKILKALTEVLGSLGLDVNPEKTYISDDVIRSAVKRDKLEWVLRRQRDEVLEKHLLIIHDHARANPNGGSVMRALAQFCRRLRRCKRCETARAMISIVTDIAYTAPRTYPVCMEILSVLLRFIEGPEEKTEILNRIVKRFSRLPNTGYLDVWLQRIAVPLKAPLEEVRAERLCRIVCGDTDTRLWCHAWLDSEIAERLSNISIIDWKRLESVEEVIQPQEVELFLPYF